jgi:flavorubredoxin
MKTFLESVKELRKTTKLDLSGKIGAVFGSYAWDGGWLTDGLEAEIKALGFKVVTPGISVVDRMGAMGIRIDEDSLKRCQELGKNIAMEFAV